MSFVKVERKNRYGEFKVALINAENVVIAVEKTHNKFNENGDEIDTTLLKKEYVVKLSNGYSFITNETSYNDLVKELTK